MLDKTFCINRLIIVDEDFDICEDPKYIAIYNKGNSFVVPNVKFIFDVAEVFYIPFQLNNKRVYLEQGE